MDGKLNEFLMSNFNEPLERIQNILRNNPGLTSVDAWEAYLVTNNSANDIAELHLEMTAKKFSFTIENEEVSAIGFVNFVKAVYEHHGVAADNNVMQFFESLVNALIKLNVVSEQIQEIREKVKAARDVAKAVYAEGESVRTKKYPGLTLDRIIQEELAADYPQLFQVITIMQNRRKAKVYDKIAGSSMRATSPVVKLEEFNRVAKEIFLLNMRDIVDNLQKDSPLMMSKMVLDNHNWEGNGNEIFYNVLSNEELYSKMPSLKNLS